MSTCKHVGHQNTPMFNLIIFQMTNNILHISVRLPVFKMKSIWKEKEMIYTKTSTRRTPSLSIPHRPFCLFELYSRQERNMLSAIHNVSCP